MATKKKAALSAEQKTAVRELVHETLAEFEFGKRAEEKPEETLSPTEAGDKVQHLANAVMLALVPWLPMPARGSKLYDDTRAAVADALRAPGKVTEQ